jgi:ATP-dependent Clp protease adapter protein ClpS
MQKQNESKNKARHKNKAQNKTKIKNAKYQQIILENDYINK